MDPQTNTVTVRDYDEVLDATADGPRRGDQARTYHTVSANLLQDYLKVGAHVVKTDRRVFDDAGGLLHRADCGIAARACTRIRGGGGCKPSF